MKRVRVRYRFEAGLLAAVAFAALVVVAEFGRPVEARAEGPKATAGHIESDAIRGLIAKYARSIDGADTALAAEVWSRSPDVSFIHPRGHERGWEEIKRNFYENTMGAMFTDRKLTPKDVAVHVLGDAAYAEFYWGFSAKFKENGQPIKTNGRETQVFLKADGRWKLVHVHYSGMPVSARREGF